MSQTFATPGQYAEQITGSGAGTGSGGTASTVNQGTPGSTPWPVSATQGTSPWVVSQTTPSPQDASAGTVTALASTAVSGTASTTIVPAAPGTRWRATIYNTSTSIVWARADGGTAAVGTGIPIPAGGAYEWVYPLTGAAPAPAINAIMATSTAGTVSGEYVQ